MSTWRELCRNAAEEQALTEGMSSWSAPNKKKVPFNYRWEHLQQVVQLALWMAAQTGADPEIVEAASWLHDIRKSERKHGIVGAVVASRLLATSDFPAHKIAAVADAIRKHVGLHRHDEAPLQPLEAAVLWDADKLSKLGVEALVIALSVPAVNGLTLAQRRKYVDEFTRTVLSRTVTCMNTEPARILAQVRYDDMLSVLNKWKHEEEIERRIASLDHL